MQNTLFLAAHLLLIFDRGNHRIRLLLFGSSDIVRGLILIENGVG